MRRHQEAGVDVKPLRAHGHRNQFFAKQVLRLRKGTRGQRVRFMHDQDQLVVDNGREDELRQVDRVRRNEQIDLVAEKRAHAIEANAVRDIEIHIGPCRQVVRRQP